MVKPYMENSPIILLLLLTLKNVIFILKKLTILKKI